MTNPPSKIAEVVDTLARTLLGRPRGHRGPHAGGTCSHPGCHGAAACEIPLPCWYPRAAGMPTSHAHPRATATLRIHVTNCGPTTRLIRPEASGGVTLHPATLTLPPMQSGLIAATFTLPADAVTGEEYDRVVWIRGCQQHYVRWRIVAAHRGRHLQHEVHVEDRPDHLHHWYDHFYCRHPCHHRSGAAAPGS